MAGLIDYSKFQEYNRPKKRKSWPFLVLLLLGGCIFITTKNVLTNKKSVGELINPIAKEIIDSGTEILNPDKNSDALGKIVQKELPGTEKNYAIAIKNFKTGERYYLNEHEIFDSASLYKLFVMATVFQKIQNGNLDKADIISQEIPILNNKFRISSDSAELTEGNITLPVQSALTRMITISDNYSALLLAENVKLSQVALFMRNNSFTDSHVGTNGDSPSTSAFDVMHFFEKLYREDLATKPLTQDMLVLLKNQTLNNKIPKYLPRNTIVAHKTGELNKFSHDAGIVYSPKGDYIIVVLTKTASPTIANEKISRISKAIYYYFAKK